jgi:hypothetical protein
LKGGKGITKTLSERNNTLMKGSTNLFLLVTTDGVLSMEDDEMLLTVLVGIKAHLPK